MSLLTLIVAVVAVLIAFLTALIGFLTLIALIAVAFGFLEIKKWNDRRKDLENIVERGKTKLGDLEKTLKETAEKSNILVAGLQDEIAEKKRQISDIVLSKEISEEVKKQTDELAKKINLIEKLGLSLNVNDYITRGNDYFNKANFQDAIIAYDKALKIDPKNIAAWSNKGLALGRSGYHEEEVKAYDEVLKIDPKNIAAWSNKGLALCQLGRHEEGLKAYDEVLKINPKDANTLYNKSCLYSLKKEKKNALEYLIKAIGYNAKYKEDAKTDKDFKWLWEDDEFKKIVDNPDNPGTQTN